MSSWREAATALRGVALASAVASGAIGCGNHLETEPVYAAEPVVERLADDAVVIRWEGAPGDQLPIFAGRSPREIDHTRPIAVLTNGSVLIDELDSRERYFFEIVGPDERRQIVSERLLPLEGAHNFRDLGGYRTLDGRSLRWGMLYRSDQLSGLTDDDLQYLERLHISLVCDLRGLSEVAAKPDRLPAEHTPEVAHFPISDEALDAAVLREAIIAGKTDGIDFAQLLVHGNRAYVGSAAGSLAGMFQRISDPRNLPAVVHCTSGKDRAGFATAVLLLALGVPEDTVLADYLLTNEFTRARTERSLWLIRVRSFFRTDPERVRPLLDARPEYLEAALDAIDEQYGSVDAYLRKAAGLTDAARVRLQDALLEPPR